MKSVGNYLTSLLDIGRSGIRRDRKSNASDKQHWEQNPEIASQNQWTSNRVIGEAIYRRMSGGASNGHWLPWLFRDHFRGRRFSRVLSPGCGVGDHEISLMELGMIDHLDAFDFSAASVALAKRKAAEKKLNINFYIDDINQFHVPKNRRYDMVFCSGSVHHVRELERFFRVVRDVIAPGGIFVFNEYVGATYNIYPQHQSDIVNRLLNVISPELRCRPRLERSSVDAALAYDASESVRSSLIMPFAETYFDFELRQSIGGAVLHPLYPLLAHDRLSRDTPEAETIVRLLVEFEAILLEEKVLETDFVLCVCRNKSSGVPS